MGSLRFELKTSAVWRRHHKRLNHESTFAELDIRIYLAEQMLELHKKLGGAKLSSEKEMIQRRIDATDSDIDRLVYEFYGLTDEEIKIVERICS